MSQKLYVQALGEAIAEEMKRDEKVFVVGESVRGAGFGITMGLTQMFGPERCLDTPIAETGVVGAALGSALAGYRPVADLMFADFMMVAGDEVFLKTAQWRFLHGTNIKLPLVLFAGVGGGMMLANEHSKMMTGYVAHTPGLKLVLPSTPYDAKGLLKTAIRDDNPVCYFWHKMLLMSPGEIPDEEYTIPFGQAVIRKEGSDVTVVAWSMMAHHALAVAQELEGQVGVEVIDPRTLEPFDLPTVLKSVEKTGRLVIVDEDTSRCGFAAELAMQVVENGFDLLDAPIQRVCAPNYPIPGGFMEAHYLPGPAAIKAAIASVTR